MFIFGQTTYRRIVVVHYLLILLSLIPVLAVSGLNAANYYFANRFKNQAREALVTGTVGLKIFKDLQESVINVTAASIAFSIISALYGLFIAAKPSELAKKGNNRAFYYTVTHAILFFALIVLGAFLANAVHSYQTLYKAFTTNKVLYYSLLYYGGIGQAVYSVLVIFSSIILARLLPSKDLFERSDKLQDMAAMADIHQPRREEELT
ncbi:hypothetical protein B0T17DRAFT_511699 [Bombardia bombarda]|uniref:Uncharacterized protein n=1 Tax=Bombardia bombarda TaxID=252184 RepID=A0AA39U4Y0_9PEZI|nr:hypothetical protein B0T17DRAFT_511699 [Bombardia bombarda]